MCNQINFSGLISVKILRDGDGDGKCQEENGKWIPCPPGVHDGSLISQAGHAIGKIGKLGTISKPTHTKNPQPGDSITLPSLLHDNTALDHRLFNHEIMPLHEFDRTIYPHYMFHPEQPDRFDYNKPEDHMRARDALRQRVTNRLYNEYLKEHEKRTTTEKKLYTTLLTQEQHQQLNPPPPKPQRQHYKTDTDHQNALKNWQQQQDNTYQKYVNNYNLRNNIIPPEHLDEDGNIKPELIDQYVLPARQKAADKAKKIEQQTQQQAQQENRSQTIRSIDWATLHQNWADIINNNNDQNTQELDKIEQQLKTLGEQIFDHKITGLDGKTYTTKTTGMTIDEYEGIKYSGHIYDQTGKKIGTFDRTLNPSNEDGYTEIHHDYLKIDKENQNAGIATTFNALNEHHYHDAGIAKITVDGASSGNNFKGATHWPKNGYNWDGEYQKDTFLDIIQDAIDTQPEQFDNPTQLKIIQELVNAAREDYQTQIHPADLLQWTNAQKWFQQQNAQITYSRYL